MNQAFYFSANPYHPESIDAAERLCKCLSNRGARIYTCDWLAAAGIGQKASFDKVAPKLRAYVIFGGDGTLLRFAPAAAQAGVPVLGVHAGTVGFLMDGNPAEAESLAQTLLAPQYLKTSHALLDVQLGDRHEFALNDVSLTRGEHPGAVEVDVYADREWIFSPHGDGVVVSTALGSTAYALAAGGPILQPDTACLVVMPIAGRELLQRPIVLPESTSILLHARASARRQLQLAIDGQILIPLTEDTRCIIRPAACRLERIHPNKPQFFYTLREKLLQWNQQSAPPAFDTEEE